MINSKQKWVYLVESGLFLMEALNNKLTPLKFFKMLIYMANYNEHKWQVRRAAVSDRDVLIMFFPLI